MLDCVSEMFKSKDGPRKFLPSEVKVPGEDRH